MNYFDSPENVQQYIDSAEGYDGRDLIALLAQYLPAGSSVLEIGMGPGKDLALLAADYDVTGSDSSQIFVERYRAMHPAADPLLLDAVTLETDRRFDALYSNKVLHHLTREELAQSFRRQAAILNPDGVALHSFWYGDYEEEHAGLRFVYYNEAILVNAYGDHFDLLTVVRFGEFEDNDSLAVVLKKRSREREHTAS